MLNTNKEPFHDEGRQVGVDILGHNIYSHSNLKNMYSAFVGRNTVN